MFHWIKKSLSSSLTVINILIVFCVLCSCSSGRNASVYDHSGSIQYSGRVHLVARGETLFSIAWKYNIECNKLADFNGIKPPYTIYPHQEIRLDIPKNNTNVRRSTAAENNVNTDKKALDKRSKYNTKNIDWASKTVEFDGSLKWQWPVKGKIVALLKGELELNKGIDLVGKLGEPVLAAASGQVVYAGGGLSSYGKMLIIKHNETFLSAYAHNSELLVKEGDFVKGGQRIADMGSSGTDRVKLHFEIRCEGSPVDPLKYLPKR